MPGSRFGWMLAVAALVAGGAPAQGAGEPARGSGPRPISAAERAAIELVIAHAEQGPRAWWERLSSDSPLRSLESRAAIEEIGVRLGPRQGASWRLETPLATGSASGAVFSVEFASGVDDVVVIELAPEEGFRLRSVRTLVDPVSPASGAGAGAGRARARFGWLSILGLLALPPLLAAVTARRYRLRSAAGSAILGLACACWMDAQDSDAARSGPAVAELRSVHEFREALAAGRERPRIGAAQASGPARSARDLWLAQSALSVGSLDQADNLLKRAGGGPEIPLGSLLRARLAVARLDLKTARAEFDRVLVGPFDEDGLRLEEISAGLLSDDAWRDEIEVDSLVAAGSRRSEAWLLAAAKALEATDEVGAEHLLKTGWELRPLPRADLLRDSALAILAARPTVFPLLGLDRAEEPANDARRRGETDGRLSVPAGFEASLCGRELRLGRGDFELLIPAAEQLAPANVTLESATLRSRRRASRALASVPSILAAARAGGGRTEARLERIALEALEALGEQLRWREVLELSTALSPDAAHARPEIARFRARALDRLGPADQALEALIDLAEREVRMRRAAPDLLLELAESLARKGDYLRAFKLAERAAGELPLPALLAARDGFRLSLELATDSRRLVAHGFEVRSPRSTGERYPKQVAQILGWERERLRRWIPRGGGREITVELLPWESFGGVYGSLVGGVTLSDGRVRLPFADSRSLEPEVVRVLGHELAHSLLREAGGETIPRWFHEGLAQHVEMGTGRLNPVPELEREGRVLAFPVLEPVLAGFAEPSLVEIAYGEAAWAVHFLEARWGVRAIHRLQEEFSRGEDSETALRTVTGLGAVEFDREFRRWAMESAPRAWSLEVRDYAGDLEMPFDPEAEE